MLNAQCPADVMGGYEVAMRFCHLVVNGRRQSTIQSHIASTGYSLLTTRIPILYTVYVSQIWTPGKPLAQATVWSYSYGCVRLNWAKSMKMDGGEVEYDIRVFKEFELMSHLLPDKCSKQAGCISFGRNSALERPRKFTNKTNVRST